MALSLTTELGQLEFTRYADGTIHIIYAPEAPPFVLTEDQAAQIQNYFVASATALQSTKDEVAAHTLEAADQALVEAAWAATEVIP